MHRSTVEIDKITKKTLGLLKHYIEIDAAYLFGSYVHGQPHEYSDIDLAVFSHSVNKMGIEKKMTILSKTREEIGSEVEIHLFSEKCLKDARPTNFYGYILKTGKKIYSKHA